MTDPFRYRDLLSDPRKALFGQLTLYYLVLGLLVLVLVRAAPDVAKYLYTWQGPGGTGSGNLSDLAAQLAAQNTVSVAQGHIALALLISTVGAMTLMVPVTWVYIGTHRRRDLDQSMVESLLVLPIAVAGVVVIVQDSLPLAFSLAGIFAGIQFRSKLKFYADAHFLFASIGIGLAAGIGALHIAAVMSLCFNYVAYGIWRLNYGAESGARHLRYPTDSAKEDAHRRKLQRHGNSVEAPGATQQTPAAPLSGGVADRMQSESSDASGVTAEPFGRRE